MSKGAKEGEPLGFEQYRRKLEEQGLLGLSGPDRLMKHLGLPPEAKYDIGQALFDDLLPEIVIDMIERRREGSKESLTRKNSLTRKRAQHPQIRSVEKNPPR